MKHPTQLFDMEDERVIFRENPIIKFLVTMGPFSMEALTAMPWSAEDMLQLCQLMGYSTDLLGTRFHEKFPKHVQFLDEQAEKFKAQSKLL